MKPTALDIIAARAAAPRSLVRYAVDLANKNRDALGFLPTPRLEDYDARGQILWSFENDEPDGYLVFGNAPDTMHIYQACVQYDSRRRDHGLALVCRLVEMAKRRGRQSISLWCADDLESNQFWRIAGFTLAGQRLGSRQRGRLHNHWVMPLDAGFGFAFDSSAVARPAVIPPVASRSRLVRPHETHGAQLLWTPRGEVAA